MRQIDCKIVSVTGNEIVIYKVENLCFKTRDLVTDMKYQVRYKFFNREAVAEAYYKEATDFYRTLIMRPSKDSVRTIGIPSMNILSIEPIGY